MDVRALDEAGLTVGNVWDLLTRAAVEHDAFEGTFEHPRVAAVDSLRHLFGSLRDRTEECVGLLGLLTASMMIAHEFDRRRGLGFESASDPTAKAVFAELKVLFEDARVLLALKAVYGVANHDGADAAQATAVWEDLDFVELRLHRLGTTSFILAGPWIEKQGRRAKVALKCVLLPYTRIAAIARATEGYARRYGAPGLGGAGEGDADGSSPHLAEVYASTRAWVAMELINGRTLREELDARFGDQSAAQDQSDARARVRGPERLRLDALCQLAPPLFRALSDIQRLGLTHHDLTPTNIIFTRDSAYGSGTRAVLIDFGRNHLYTRTIGALEGPEASFVAPETKQNAAQADPRLADLYSLGKLLIAIGGTEPGQGAEVPDAFYVRTPLLARFVEDLVDSDPNRRLLLYGDSGWTYADLGTEFAMELQAVSVADREGLLGDDRPTLRGLFDLATPTSRTASRQWRIRRVRAQQRRLLREAGREESEAQPGGTGPVLPEVAGPAVTVEPDEPGFILVGRPSEQALRRLSDRARVNSRRAGVLLFWSALCGVCWALVFLVISVQLARDAGIDPTPEAVDVVRWFTGVIGWTGATAAISGWERQLTDLLGPPGAHNLDARIVGGTFALVNVKHYQNIFAGISPLNGAGQLPLGRRVHAWASEFWIRLFAFWWITVVLAPNFGDPLWWPICTAIGLSVQLMLNATVSSFANLTVKDARRNGFSTVPPHSREITGLKVFSRWTPSMFVFLLMVWPLAYFISRGNLDGTPYALMLGVSNIGIFYVVKCGLDAPAIRSGLARAFLASERAAAARVTGTTAGSWRPAAPRARQP
ncbi:hypothetical protein [Plantactinospora sp. CA-290183]|uniref:hypothetical protein n=1 Tax=Plantactinospora sp. CA-290183 TaxID=3240006 RepID=UPI003D93F0D2